MLEWIGKIYTDKRDPEYINVTNSEPNIISLAVVSWEISPGFRIIFIRTSFRFI